MSVADHDGCKNAIDPLFLFACGVSWRNSADTEAGWELIRAAKSFGSQARTIGRALLAYSQEDLTGLEGQSGAGPVHGSAETGSNAWGWSPESWWGGGFRQEAAMNTPYGLEIVENCLSCNLRKDCAFCNFSPEVLKHFNSLGRISILPGGAVLFVEGQMPRGIFVLCAGKVIRLTLWNAKRYSDLLRDMVKPDYIRRKRSVRNFNRCIRTCMIW